MNDFLKPSQLLLEQFRKIAYAAPKKYRWIVVWVLLYIEPIYINLVVRETVDKAVQEYHEQMDALEPSSLFTTESKPSEVEGLDELHTYYDPTAGNKNRDTTQE